MKNWIKYAGFEESHNYVGLSRGVFERAVEFYGEDHMDEKLYISFAKFEERQKEVHTSTHQGCVQLCFSCNYLLSKFNCNSVIVCK